MPISVFGDYCCNLHNMGNYCALNEHPRSKNERRIRIMSHRLVVRMFTPDPQTKTRFEVLHVGDLGLLLKVIL